MIKHHENDKRFKTWKRSVPYTRHTLYVNDIICIASRLKLHIFIICIEFSRLFTYRRGLEKKIKWIKGPSVKKKKKRNCAMYDEERPVSNLTETNTSAFIYIYTNCFYLYLWEFPFIIHFVLAALCALDLLRSFVGGTLCKWAVHHTCARCKENQRLSNFSWCNLVWFALCKHLPDVCIKSCSVVDSLARLLLRAESSYEPFEHSCRELDTQILSFTHTHTSSLSSF